MHQSISIPISISENIDILNSSSGYYNDICYTATSESGTDISLKDRKTQFVEDNKMICQEDCDFSNYNSISQKAQCLCKVKESSSSFADIYINKTKLLENFGDIKSFLNINYLSCYKSLFIPISIIHNIGFFIMVFILIFHIINIFIFIKKQFRQIKKTIKYIIYAIQKLKITKSRKKNQNEDDFIRADKRVNENYKIIFNSKVITQRKEEK